MPTITPTQFEAFVNVLGNPELVKVSYQYREPIVGLPTCNVFGVIYGLAAMERHKRPAAYSLPGRSAESLIELYQASCTGCFSHIHIDRDGAYISRHDDVNWVEKLEFIGASWISQVKDGSERTVVIKPEQVHVKRARGPKQDEKIEDPKLDDLVRTLMETDAGRVIYPPHLARDYQDVWVNMWENRT